MTPASDRENQNGNHPSTTGEVKMKRLPALVVLALIAAACGLEAGDTTNPTPPVLSTVPATTTTVAPTTTTSVPADQTPPNITVWGGLVRFSPVGVVTISGTLDEPGTVSIPGAAITVDGMDWSADFEREPGVHEVTISAEDAAGNLAEAVMRLTVDPDLEVVFAYVTAFDGVDVTADYAVFLSGEEAHVAAREDGVIGADETVPNDFYIRNDNPLLRTLAVAEGAPVLLQTCFVDGPCVRETAVSLAQWAELLAGGFPTDLPEGWQSYGGGALPYWLTLQDGVVVQIGEQYLP